MIARLGSDYGGHSVDLSLLSKNSVVYSFGIGNDVTFDTSIIEHTGCTVHAFDPTTKAVEWIKLQPKINNFFFYDLGLSNFDGIAKFTPPPEAGWVSFSENTNGSISFPVKKLSTIMKKLNHNKLSCLKMDIEGSEYGVLKDIIDERIDVDQICLEFHNKSEIEILEYLESIGFLNIYKLTSKEKINFLFKKVEY
jgi:FkbM family methyltransferase